MRENSLISVESDGTTTFKVKSDRLGKLFVDIYHMGTFLCRSHIEPSDYKISDTENNLTVADLWADDTICLEEWNENSKYGQELAKESYSRHWQGCSDHHLEIVDNIKRLKDKFLS